MKNFIITRREVWTSGVLVTANTQEEAIKIVEDCGGTELDGLLEYSHTLDTDTWTTEEISEEEAEQLLDIGVKVGV